MKFSRISSVCHEIYEIDYKVIIMLLGAITAFSFVGCNRETEIHRRLREANNIMNEFPDSALRILENIDTRKLSSMRDSAAYGMLLTESRIQTNTEQSDSLITLAIRYYGIKNRESRKLLKCNYFKGVISIDKEEYTFALPSMLEAYKLAILYEDDYWIGKTALKIRDIYEYLESPIDELYYAQMAKESFIRIGKEGHIINSSLAVASSFIHGSMYDEAVNALMGIKDELFSYYWDDSSMHAYFNYLLASGYYGKQDYIKVIGLLSSDLLKTDDRSLAILRDSYEKIGNTVESKAIADYVSKRLAMHNCTAETHNENVDGDINKNKFACEFQNTREDFKSGILDKPVQMNLEYNDIFDKLQKKSDALHNRTVSLIVMTGTSLIVIFILIILYIYKRSRRREHENEAIIEGLESVLKKAGIELVGNPNHIDVIKSHIKSLEALVKDLRQVNDKEQIASLNEKLVRTRMLKLIQTRYHLIGLIALRENMFPKENGNSEAAVEDSPKSKVKKGRPSNKDVIKKEISKSMEKLKTDPLFIEEIKYIVNSTMSDIYNDFEKTFPSINENYKKLFLFSCIGFPISLVSVFMNISDINKVYELRRRLKDKMKASSIAECERFYNII